MRQQIQNKTYDMERALYNIKNTDIINCNFEGKNDGESVLKECRNFKTDNCSFSLRYPIWHAKKFMLLNSKMDEKARAPLWYSKEGKIKNCQIKGTKCLRECKNIDVENCIIISDEFGLRCSNLEIKNSKIEAKYFLFESKNVKIDNLNMKGKYSFQYMKNLYIKNSNLSKNLTLINCKIEGTQPLCYCKNLKLINCTMEKTDLAFEYSDVEADIKGHVDSIKNPKSGIITLDSVGEIINEDAVIKCKGIVKIRKNQNAA